MGRLTPTITTIKKLFALSGNECAYNFNGEDCSNKIIDNDNDIIGELCHIEAANEGWPRYNQNSNDQDRRDCENLILLCPIHHKKVDKNPTFTVEVLKQMKSTHENHNKNKHFKISDELINRLIIRLGIDIAVETNIFNKSNLPKYIIDKLLNELDSKDISIANKESLFKEMELKYNSLLESIGESDDTDSPILESLISNAKFEEAEILLKRSIDKKDQFIHNAVAIAAEKAYQLAILLELQLKYSEALKYYKKAVDYLPDNITYLSNLGYIFLTIGEYQKAIDIYFNVIDLSLKDKIINAEALGHFYINLGGAYDCIGQYPSAISYFDKAVEIFNNDKQHFQGELSACYNNIGLANKNQNNLTVALHYYEKAIEVYKDNTDPENYKYIAIALSNMAAVYSLHGKYKEAVIYCETSIELSLKAQFENHPDIASAYFQLGFALYCLDEHQRAIQNNEKALSIYLACFGENHPKVASCYNDLALIYNELGNSKKAIEFGEKSVQIHEATLGASHPFTMNAQKNFRGLQT